MNKFLKQLQKILNKNYSIGHFFFILFILISLVIVRDLFVMRQRKLAIAKTISSSPSKLGTKAMSITDTVDSDIRNDSTTWVVISPTQCMSNPWEIFWIKTHNVEDYNSYPRDEDKRIEIIRDYYAREGVAIIQVKIIELNGPQCASCGCSDGYDLFIQVVASDVQKMLDRGFKVPSKRGLVLPGSAT